MYELQTISRLLQVRSHARIPSHLVHVETHEIGFAGKWHHIKVAPTSKDKCFRRGPYCDPELVFVEKKSMGGEMSFRPLVRPCHSFTSR
jgi:hypothetical protein